MAQEGLGVGAELTDSGELPIASLCAFLLSLPAGILGMFALLELGSKTQFKLMLAEPVRRQVLLLLLLPSV